MREREQKKRRGKSLKKLCQRIGKRTKKESGRERERKIIERERDLRGTGNTVFREKIE